jgi:hypothetical protein
MNAVNLGKYGKIHINGAGLYNRLICNYPGCIDGKTL